MLSNKKTENCFMFLKAKRKRKRKKRVFKKIYSNCFRLFFKDCLKK